MPNFPDNKNSKRKHKYRAEKQIRVKLARKLANVQLEDPNLEPIVFVQPPVLKEFAELRELEPQKLTNWEQFSSFFENALNRTESTLKLTKLTQQKSENPLSISNNGNLQPARYRASTAQGLLVLAWY